MTTTFNPQLISTIAAQLVHTNEFFKSSHAAVNALASYNVLHTMPTDGTIVDGHEFLEALSVAITRAYSLNKSLFTSTITKPTNRNVATILAKLGLINMFENGTVSVTDKWIDMNTIKSKTTPYTTPITSENRRKKMVKGSKHMEAKKGVFLDFIRFLEKTDYHVSSFVDVIEAVRNNFTEELDAFDRHLDYKTARFEQENPNHQINKFLEEADVLNNSLALRLEEQLYSEYFGDSRGRVYHVACAGPNPQSSDMARSLYSHNVENFVEKDTPAYQMFMMELEDISGGKFCSHPYLMQVARKPVQALTTYMQDKTRAPKKPFTYVRLAMAYSEFQLTGKCDCRVGFGLDAKCSGTQYLAFIAGCFKMAKATGLTDEEVAGIDPYMMSLVELGKIIGKSTTECIKALEGSDSIDPRKGRGMIKTPYMAIQYGGGKAALMGSRDFRLAMIDMGIVDEEAREEFCLLCIEAIKEALGDWINKFIELSTEACTRKLNETGKHTFTYYHTDGFFVNKQTKPKLDVCAPFKLKYGSRMHDNLDFGMFKDDKPWTVKAMMPTAEECARTFVVNFVQGIDALVARMIGKHAELKGLRGFTSIHDCFRSCLADAPMMMDVIRDAYNEVFVENDQFENITKQLACEGEKYGFQLLGRKNIVTKELLYSENAYYFCQ